MWGIAWRNFVLQRHRYRVLVTALVLGAIVFTLLFGVTASLTKTVREKAARYFTGDVVVTKVDRKRGLLIEHEAEVWKALEASGVGFVAKHRRTLYYEADAQLFFNGASLIQRRVAGVDFGVESPSFGAMDFVAGEPPGAEGNETGIWVSDDTARRLHLKAGDAVILLLTTSRGKNTVNLMVKGIFADSSLFGFACYLDLVTLNRALGQPDDSVTELGVTLAPGWSELDSVRRLHQALGSVVSLAPLLPNWESVERWAKDHRSLPQSYGLLPLTGRLDQINDLIESIGLVNLILTLVFLVVVSIGVYNTYQMIVFERTKEIGTMRALGLQRPGVVFLFLSESVMLALVGAGMGLVLGTVVLWVLGQVDFSGNLLAEMFLVKGHLAWVWPLDHVALVVGVMVLTSLVGALVPATKAAWERPVDALRQD